MKSPGKRSRKVANFLQRLAHTGDGVFAVDPDHHITLWNQAAESLLGYSDEEVLGKNCHDVIQGRDCNGLVICSKQCSHFEVAKSLRRLPNKNLCARSKKGTDVWINVTTLSILSQRRRLSTLVHFFRNVGEITGSRERERELPGFEAKLVSGSASQTESHRRNDERNAKSVPLTGREHEVLCHLAEGMSTKIISERLYVSRITVKNHVQSILKKLQVHSRVEAIVLAFRRGLV